jgi:hypothetical protein
LVEAQKEFFADMLVTAVLFLKPTDPIDMVAMKQVPGGSVTVTPRKHHCDDTVTPL